MGWFQQMADYYMTCPNHLVCLDKTILLNFWTGKNKIRLLWDVLLIIRYIANTQFWIIFSSEGTQLFWALHNVRVECKHVLSQHITQKIQSKSRNTFMIDKHVILLFNQMHLCESETKRYKHLVSKTIEEKV